MISNDIECCANCKHRLDYPRNNKYGNVDHLCIISGYFIIEIYKDNRKVKGYSPGGRELECKYERNDNIFTSQK
jgi:hypothetical protein